MKKSLSLILAFAMVFSMFATAAFAAEAETAAELDTQGKYDALAEAGIFDGFEDGSAGLDREMTREQFAKVLAVLKGLDEIKGVTSYDDVAADRWSAGYIEAVTEDGLMDGVAVRKFDPEGVVTKEQLATVAVRALGLQPASNANVAGASDWAKGYVATALAAGVMEAQSDYTEPALRALLVEVTYAAYQLLSIEVESAEAVDEKTIKVTFNDGVTEEYELDSALAEGANTVEVEYKGLSFQVTVNYDPTPMQLTDVEALTNTKVKLVLAEAVKSADKSKIAIKDAEGAALEVKEAVLSADGKSVVVTTGETKPYTVYTVTVEGVSETYVALPVDTKKPSVTSAVVNSDATITVTFSEDVDPATASNASNYTTDPALTIEKAEVKDNVVTLTTSAQTQGALYKLTIQNVTDLSGNVMDKKEVYFGGVVDNVKPQVVSAVVNQDASLTVTFNEKVDAASATNAGNYTIDKDVAVVSASLSDDKTVVTLTTTAQKQGELYKLTIENVADVSGNVMDKKEFYFGGVVDTTKPTVSSVVSQHNAIVVTFSEKVNKEQAENAANYTLDKDLTITSASLNSAGTVVTLKTSEQKLGELYKVTIQNIADLAGNVMDKKEFYISGVVDTTAPTIVSASTTAGVNNQVVIKFSEKVDKKSAQTESNYAFDGGLLYPTKAVLDDDGVTVTLTTADQEAGKVYTVTVNNVKDLAGNVIAANSKKQFSGVNTAVTELTLQTIVPVDSNTVKLVFDRDVTQDEAAMLTFAVTHRNGSAYSIAAPYRLVQQSNKKEINVQFNSAVFASGYYYTAVVDGPALLVKTDNANVKNFGGVTLENPKPVVTTIVPVNNSAFKVYFSEPVKGLAGVTLVATKQGGTSPADDITAVSLVTDANAIVTEATFNVTSANKLASGAVYDITFSGANAAAVAGVTDAAGFDALRVTNSDGSAVKVSFGGVSLENAAPKMQAAVAKDKYNVDIVFSEPVNGAADLNNFTIVNNNDATDVVSFAGASISASSDKTVVSIALDSNNFAGFKTGAVYKVTVTAAGKAAIQDLQGKAYDTASGADEVTFGANDSANAKPEIIAVEASGTTLKLTFSEKVTGYTNQTDLFDITVDGAAVAVASGSINSDGNVITLTLNASVPAAKTGTVKVNAAGAAVLKDINGQAPKTDEVTFGTK